MSRAKTEVGKSYGVRHTNGGGVVMANDETQARCWLDHCRTKKLGCRLVIRTLVRLAPCIKLSPWRKVPDGLAVRDQAGGMRAFIEIDGADGEDPCFEAMVFGGKLPLGTEIVASQIFESSTLGAVKEWAEAKLREQGYRVPRVKAKPAPPMICGSCRAVVPASGQIPGNICKFADCCAGANGHRAGCRGIPRSFCPNCGALSPWIQPMAGS